MFPIGSQEEVAADLFSTSRCESDTVLEFDRVIRIGNVVDVEAYILQGRDIQRFAIRGKLDKSVVGSFPAGGEFEFLDAFVRGDNDFRLDAGRLSCTTADPWSRPRTCISTRSAGWHRWQANATEAAGTRSTRNTRRSAVSSSATKASALGWQPWRSGTNSSTDSSWRSDARTWASGPSPAWSGLGCPG